MDNGPPGLSQKSAAYGFEPAKVRERVDARRVAAVEGDLQRVLAHQRDVFDPELVRAQGIDSREPSRCAGLTATFGAGACPSQLLTGIRNLVPVLPRDLHHLARAIDIDVDRKRIWILQWWGP